jgi:cytochrome c biogenesis protein CcdA
MRFWRPLWSLWNGRMKEEVSGKAIASLVFGILAVTGVCPCIGSIVAIALGVGETSGVARAGVILGWIHLAMIAISLIIVALFLALGGAMAWAQ